MLYTSGFNDDVTGQEYEIRKKRLDWKQYGFGTAVNTQILQVVRAVKMEHLALAYKRRRYSPNYEYHSRQICTQDCINMCIIIIRDVRHLKEVVQTCWEQIGQDVMDRAIGQFRKRLLLVVATGGGHTEHRFH